MKIKRIVLLMACLLMISACVYAADEVSFIISYDGIVVENEAKAVNIVLEGKSAPTYTKVRVKVRCIWTGNSYINSKRFFRCRH